MYRFLDRSVWQPDEPHRLLLAAMRGWVARARRGLRSYPGLHDGFAARVLVLFDAARSGDAPVPWRAANCLVPPAAATMIADAALYVAAHLGQGTAA